MIAPRVSVIVPAYNAASTIEATLASVLAQSYTDIEIIVVDDGSTDGTGAILDDLVAREPRIRVLHQPNAGVARARNAALAVATGEWIATIDADDIWHPDKIARQTEVARAARMGPALIYSWCRRIDAEDRIIADQGRPLYRGMQFHQLLASNFLNNASNAIFRADAAREIGGFDESFQSFGTFGAEDIAFYLKLAERWPIVPAPGFLVGYRTIGNGMSADPRRMRMSVEMMLYQVERRLPRLPPPLLALARVFYDLYAAALSLRGGKRRLFAAFLFRAMLRRPLVTVLFLVCALGSRPAEARYDREGARPFLSVSPDEEAATLTLWTWFHRYRTRQAERAAGLQTRS